MKKHFYLTLLLALFSAATVWAQFAPEEGKMYALKETESGLYLDIQTLGIKDGTRNTNNISLNTVPCIIYFEAGTTDASKWKLKNANGMYVYYNPQNVNTGGAWNPQIGTTADQVHEWTIAESNGYITIARDAGNYLQVDTKAAGEPLYCNKPTGMQFTLVELPSQPYVLLKTSSGTYLSTTSVTSDTHLSIQAEGTKFVLETSQIGRAHV